MIIFVSRKYKNSFNCKAEANYARGLMQKGRLTMHFVTMEADYTMHSEPECVDGWLGLYMGTDLYYGLYDLSMLTDVIDKISGVLGDKALRVSPTKSPLTQLPVIAQSPSSLPAVGQSSNQGTPLTTPHFGSPTGSPRVTLAVDSATRASSNNVTDTSSTKPKLTHSFSQMNIGDIKGAWSLITNSSKIVKARREEILVYLDDMGITHAEDLEAHANDVGIMKKIKEFLNPTGLLDWKIVFSPNTNTCGGGGCPRSS